MGQVTDWLQKRARLSGSCGEVLESANCRLSEPKSDTFTETAKLLFPNPNTTSLNMSGRGRCQSSPQSLVASDSRPAPQYRRRASAVENFIRMPGVRHKLGTSRDMNWARSAL